MHLRNRGFTLIELMIVVALAAIVLGLGAPSFKGFVVSQRLKTATGEFVSAATFARSEAIKRNADVGLYAQAGGWQNGWTVKKGADVLGKQDEFPELTMTSAVTEVVFDGNGRLKGGGTPRVTIDIGDKKRCVSFDLSGLPKTRQGVC